MFQVRKEGHWKKDCWSKNKIGDEKNGNKKPEEKIVLIGLNAAEHNKKTDEWYLDSGVHTHSVHTQRKTKQRIMA